MGLPPESRAKRQLHGIRWDLKTQLLAMAVDRLSELVWTKTKDALHGRNKPKSVLRLLIDNQEQKREPETVAFDSPEAFERAREEMIKSMNGGSV